MPHPTHDKLALDLLAEVTPRLPEPGLACVDGLVGTARSLEH